MFKELGKSRNLGVPALALVLILLLISVPVEARRGGDGSSTNSQSGRGSSSAAQTGRTEQRVNQPSYQEIRGGANRAGPSQDRQSARVEQVARPPQTETKINVTQSPAGIPQQQRTSNINSQNKPAIIQPNNTQVRIQPNPSPMQSLQAKSPENSVIRNRASSGNVVKTQPAEKQQVTTQIQTVQKSPQHVVKNQNRVNENRMIDNTAANKNIASPIEQSQTRISKNTSTNDSVSNITSKPKNRLRDAVVQKFDGNTAKQTQRDNRTDISKRTEPQSGKKAVTREFNNSAADNKQANNSKTNWQKHQESSGADKGFASNKRLENYRGTRLQPVSSLSQKVAMNKSDDRNFSGNHNNQQGHHDGYKSFYDHSSRDWHSRPVHRYEHVYVNSHNVECHRIIWPSYSYFVYYGHGSHYNFSAVFPYYHRKYVFVSLGGWWPEDYCYARYYWYGWHPYEWYGYYPIAREVQGDTYNYYTYNYYNNNPAAPSGSSDGAVQNQVEDTAVTGDYENTVIDDTTFAAARAKASQQPAKPTETDNYFEEGVKAFEAADYNTACEKFAKALQLTPDDLIAPYAYSQSLFAKGLYQEAAAVLRAALDKVKPQQEGVFYPRGLYSDDEILLNQIDLLKKKAADNNSDSDMQLLLGYHYVGIGELELAQEPLRQASLNPINKKYADILLDLIDKIKVEKDKDSQPTKVQ